jgi:hypothetical protein
VVRRQLQGELALLRDSWSLYRSESGALARALLIVLALLAACSFVVLPFFIRDGRMSTLGEASALVVVAALVLSPLGGGLLGIVLVRLREGQSGRARDVFLGYRRFLPLAVAGVISACAFELRHTGSWHAGLGPRLVAVAAGFAISLLLIYFVPTIVDRRLPLGASLLAALRLLRPPELWRTLFAVVLLIAATLLLEEPSNLIAHRSLGLASLYMILVVLIFGPFVIAYVASLYVRAVDEQTRRDE